MTENENEQNIENLDNEVTNNNQEAVEPSTQTTETEVTENEVISNEVIKTPVLDEAEEESTESIDIFAERKVSINTHMVPGEFDWEGSKKGSIYSNADRERMSEMYEKTINEVQSNQIVEGVVVGITDRDVVLNIGFKSDGLVPIAEFKDYPNMKLGEKFDVLVVDKEDAKGQLLLSRKHAKLIKSWDRIIKSHEEDLVIEGKVKSRTKGGLVVEVEGIETFLPGSQIDVKPVRDYDQYVGRNMEFKVVKINHQLRNAVVSHKILIEKDLEAIKSELISKLEKGQVLEGVVKNITDFGVFVDLGGVDGLLHITDISWKRISHPNEVLELDQTINVVVLDYDDDKKRISLGKKQLDAHPWDELQTELEVGAKVKGSVVTLADYGAFIELTPGVEGLIHVSEMSWSQHLRNPSEFLQIGNVVEAVVISVDKEERKLSLGLKQLTPDPWIDIDNKYPVGSKHTGVVRNLTNYGLFVELGEGIDGLVHVSDLSWTKKINHPSEFIKKDDSLEVLVLEIDKENRRVSLGHKQLEDNPWDTFETIFLEGSVHTGKVISFEDKTASVLLPYNVEASSPRKQLGKEDGSTLKEEEEAQFKVLEFNKENRKIVVSHSRTWQEDKDEATKKPRTAKAAASTDTGNNLLGEMNVLSDLKDKIAAGEKKAQQEAIDKMDTKATKKTAKKAEDTESESSTEETAE